MANWIEWTPEQRADWDKWLSERPPHVRAVCEKYPADRLYRLKGTGQRCPILSYGEKADGIVSLTVAVDGRFNLVLFSREVFGVDPSELEECDLPGPDEELGDMAEVMGYDDAQLEENILAPMREKMKREGKI